MVRENLAANSTETKGQAVTKSRTENAFQWRCSGVNHTSKNEDRRVLAENSMTRDKQIVS